jgi:DNA-binding CsgD family transcriptional regulator
MANRMHLSLKTVQTYAIRAREKFSVDNFKQLVREAIRWDDSSKK